MAALAPMGSIKARRDRLHSVRMYIINNACGHDGRKNEPRWTFLDLMVADVLWGDGEPGPLYITRNGVLQQSRHIWFSLGGRGQSLSGLCYNLLQGFQCDDRKKYNRAFCQQSQGYSCWRQ